MRAPGWIEHLVGLPALPGVGARVDRWSGNVRTVQSLLRAVHADARVAHGHHPRVDLPVGGLEVGWTFYSPSVWAGPVNPTCKLLLLSHAFDALGAGRVTLKTDALNARSRSAILRLGASYDGTLRHHRLRADGSVRDTAYFSVLAAEWPAVRDGLLARLPD